MKQRASSHPSNQRSSSTRTKSNRTKSRITFAAGVCVAGVSGALMWQRAQTYRRDLAQLKTILPPAPPLENNDRLLIVAPHPDDEILATGALICEARRKNLEVCVVFLTNGDGSGSSYIAQNLREGRRPTFQQLAATRQNEACAALKEIGVANENIVFLGYPDGGLGAMSGAHFRDDAPFFSQWTNGDNVPYANALSPQANYAGENVVRDLVQIFEKFRPTRIYTTDEHDTHADHVAAYEFTQKALEQWRDNAKDLTASSSTRSAENQSLPDARFFAVLVHHHIWPVPHGLHLQKPLAPPQKLSHLAWTQLAVDDETLARKKRALECYKSQLVWTPLYLRSFLRRTELFREIDL